METAGGRALTPSRGTLLRVRRSSKLGASALAAAGGSFAALALDFAGHPAPAHVTRTLAMVSAPLAAVVAIRTAAGFWRGPALLDFPIAYAAPCHGAEAQRVRGAACLRGSLGGAGHLHPLRLAFPVLAWLGASVMLAHVAVGVVGTPGCRWAMAVAAVGLLARAILPARAFWYRERRDGSLLVYPASAAVHASGYEQALPGADARHGGP